MESPKIPLPPGQSGSSLELLDEELLELEEELLLDDELELLEELLLDDDPEPELLDPEPEELLPDEELELEELLELLDELESDSSPVGTPPSVNMITALK